MATGQSTTRSPGIPTTMRAWQFSSTNGGLEKNLHLNESAPVPTYGGDKVLVKVLAAAINPADYKVPELPIVGRLIFGKDATPGMDFAGVVAAVNGSGGGFKQGQRVFGRLNGPREGGTLADYVAAKPSGLAVLPEGVKAEDAAGVGTAGLTAYQAIVPYVKAGRGDSVFVNGGSGGTGVWSIQIAKQLGCRVVATCSGSNVEFCKNLGADEVIDYRTTDVVESLKSMVASGGSSESGRKFDLMVDNVGTPGALYWKSHELLSENGRFVQVGTEATAGATWELMTKLLWPGFLGGGKRRFQFLTVRNDADQLGEMGRWLQQGNVKTPIHQGEVYSFEETAKAFSVLRTHRARGKIVIRVNDE